MSSPLVTVVVPIYNVEEYLTACLDSIAHQTLEDIEVVMVNDGSTDGSEAIAERYAEADPRFRLITQENGGLSRARNTGADAARGEYLGFVDSDDVIPRDAYELLVTSLQETGSDFATGNVMRLMTTGLTPARFVARVFERTRKKTHVTKFRPLLVDRIVPNKLWRRSFWEANGFRFPEGVVHEDIPVVLPAQYAAKSVDVIAEPVYLYRVREGSDLSITQRRLDMGALTGRIDAVEHARDYFASKGARRVKRWYEESVVAEDLRYFLDVLDGATDEYRELFLDRVNKFLDGASRGIYRDLSAMNRLKWWLVRHRRMPELVEVLRFQKERMRETPPVRIGRRWYGDYPFRDDPDLKIPRSVFRLSEELVVSPRVDDLRFENGELTIGGYAFIAGIGAPERDTQKVTVTVVRRGGLRALRMRTLAIRLRASVVHRPDVTASTTQASADVQWSGFEATLKPRKLRSLGRWRPGTWDLYVTVRAGGVTRRRSRFLVDSPRPVRAVDHVLEGGRFLKVSPAPTGEIALHLRDGWASIVGHDAAGRDMQLFGRMHGPGTRLRLARPGSEKLEYPLDRDGDEFTVRVPLDDLAAAVALARPEPEGTDYAGAKVWNLWTVGPDAPNRRVSLGEHVREGEWKSGDDELALIRTKDGDALLIARSPQPVVESARWTDGGEIELSGELWPGTATFDELVLVGRLHLEQHAFPLRIEGGRFFATLTPGHVRSLAGELPLQEGNWELFARRKGVTQRDQMARVLMTQLLFESLPMRHVIGHKTLLLSVTPELQPVITAFRDLDDLGERGRYNQRVLRQGAYERGQGQPLRDAVVFMSFGGRQFSDSPRAVHEELVRRGSELEQLWVVRDARCVVPDTATVLRSASRDYYDALAGARFVVANGFLPDWFERREDQVVVQTLQGTPLKRIGLDVPHLRSTMRRSARWAAQVANWQYLVSGSSFATRVLRQAYGVEGEVLEIGTPRNDLLADPGALRARGDRVRDALGLPEGARVVLYAPTFRDHVIDRRGRYRLDQRLDVERLLPALGPDGVLLIRKHPLVADPVLTGDDARVHDVSAWPDATELLAAADVLVTDYSSLAYDFALTNRPILFFTYDLDVYRDEIRGFYVDLEAEAPGPLLRTTDELADALGGVGYDVPAEYNARYRAWRERFCELDDGRASARLVERLFSH
jgi:CDP-glycerol glycerophosphotransferase